MIRPSLLRSSRTKLVFGILLAALAVLAALSLLSRPGGLVGTYRPSSVSGGGGTSSSGASFLDSELTLSADDTFVWTIGGGPKVSGTYSMEGGQERILLKPEGPEGQNLLGNQVDIHVESEGDQDVLEAAVPGGNVVHFLKR